MLATVIGVVGWLALIIGVQCAIGIATGGFVFHGPGAHGLGAHGLASEAARAAATGIKRMWATL